MNQEVRARLLASINAGRLVVVCGAGLSVAAPSSIPSARMIAEKCFDKYRLESDPNCDLLLRSDLGALAEHFIRLGTLESVFLGSLVPWSDFIRPFNAGHAAIADFLVTKSAIAGISSNYDTLIESSALNYGSDFLASLDGDEASARQTQHGPLLKVHGCAFRDRASTVWAQSQLVDQDTRHRIENSTTWMNANLRQKDLLIVGFWSDWEYLNEIIGSAMADVTPLSVIVVDPSPTNILQEKAPELWQIIARGNVNFDHVQESACDALDELRREFSVNYLQQILDAGRNEFEQTTGNQCDPDWLTIDRAGSETLYGLRRDAEGVPACKPATRIRPRESEVLGYFHLLLRQAGAIQVPSGYKLNERIVRVINGAGKFLTSLRTSFDEPPAATVADVVVAVGATDLSVPANVVREGRVGDTVRPCAPGTWLDENNAVVELGL